MMKEVGKENGERRGKSTRTKNEFSSCKYLKLVIAEYSHLAWMSYYRLVNSKNKSLFVIRKT